MKDIFNVNNASDVKLRFSQYTLESVGDILRRICRNSGLFYHFNENGAIRMFGRKRASSYGSGDVTQSIDFNDCDLGSIGYTDGNYLRNKVKVEYNFDYGSEQTIEETAFVEDATSKGTTSDGYAITNTLVSEATYINDSTVATAYANTLLDYYKDRKPIIKLSTGKMKYINIEIGDIVDIDNFPSDIKIFGTALSSSDYFMVTNVSKSPKMIILTLTEVS